MSDGINKNDTSQPVAASDNSTSRNDTTYARVQPSDTVVLESSPSQPFVVNASDASVVPVQPPTLPPVSTTSTPTAATTEGMATDEPLPSAIDVMSQNFPKPFPGMYTANWRYGSPPNLRNDSV